jgi:sugar phosphate isomerase/epimerase
LRAIADAGFNHIHWCHHWHTDYLYSRYEVAQIRRWLKAFGLALLDLHGTAGVEKHWAAGEEWRRKAGVELVANRIDMTARLGGDAVVMHVGGTAWLPGLRKSLDELRPLAARRGVRIAVENPDFEVVETLLSEYEPAYVGLCYDCGHGNLGDRSGLDHLARVEDRLIAVHLHDNDGTGDQHKLPFMGTVDWDRLTRSVAASSYRKPLNLEVGMLNSGIDDEAAFLARAMECGVRLAGMVDRASGG